MKFTFSDINNDKLYEKCRVLFITGEYSIFNNLVEDKIRDICRGEEEGAEISEELLEEFGGADELGKINDMELETFLEAVRIPPLNGKWFTSLDYKFLTKKQREKLMAYIKRPNDNGILVIKINEYKDYRELLYNKIIANSEETHLIQLQFPNREGLKEIVYKKLREKQVELPERAVDIFVMRMGINYDEYEETLDYICLDREGTHISISEFNQIMKGIENYDIDDFIEFLLRPMNSKKISSNRKIYRMVESIISDIGARSAVYKIRRKIDSLIDFRILINSGIIPINVKYSVAEAKERIGEDHKLYKINDYSFRRNAKLASKTSLKDLVYIKMILSNIDVKWDEKEYEKALFSVIHRSTLSPERLINDIGISNTLKKELFDINGIFYFEKVNKENINNSI